MTRTRYEFHLITGPYEQFHVSINLNFSFNTRTFLLDIWK